MKTFKKILAVVLIGFVIVYVVVFARDLLAWEKCADDVEEAVAETIMLGAPSSAECDAVRLQGSWTVIPMTSVAGSLVAGSASGFPRVPRLGLLLTAWVTPAGGLRPSVVVGPNAWETSPRPTPARHLDEQGIKHRSCRRVAARMTVRN
ncbi:hypothetical protein Psi02_69410 [Planotetraspora silvatica]|uniref:Uncharacterized protein n=1 Tax=Planotetraspora silvatica TaxID=234614 RepID=A0A8J3UVB1_9ACTN|nr:hypothetical protein [Planotetraspora silvatica]GII50517.1 hypothetical protein Psi02_69410 [Planotetraspora silvatica]